MKMRLLIGAGLAILVIIIVGKLVFSINSSAPPPSHHGWAAPHWARVWCVISPGS